MYYTRNCGCSGLGATVQMVPNVADQLATITRTLRSGVSGPDVAVWQAFIGATADGKFGPKTAALTMAWQRSHGLQADGVVGPKTKAAAIASLPVAQPFPIQAPKTGTPVTTMPVTGPVQPKPKARPKKPKATVTGTNLTTMPVVGTQPAESSGMGTGTTVLIGLGIVAVIGAVIIGAGS